MACLKISKKLLLEVVLELFTIKNNNISLMNE